jgi:transcriptional regulator with XRE-family HTH domain
MTLRVLGKRAKCAQSTLCEIEKGKISPSSRLLPRLAKGLDVGVGDLFEGVA